LLLSCDKNRTNYLWALQLRKYFIYCRLIQQNHDIDKLIKIVEPIETVLDDILAVKVNNHEASKLKNGMSINQTIDSEFPFSGEVYATCGEKIVAICKYANGQIQPQKVFNLQ